MSTNGHTNGHGANGSATAGPGAATPPRIVELAEGCVRFVERALGVKLDYQLETLGVLDHYLASARQQGRDKPAVSAVIQHSAGAYLGEVVRRRHPSWWRAEGDDPSTYRVEFEEVYLAFSPVLVVADCLGHAEHAEEEGGDLAGIEIDDEDRDAVHARLADLPDVSEEEYYAPSTRVEVIDITIEAIRARRLAAGIPASAALGPADYED